MSEIFTVEAHFSNRDPLLLAIYQRLLAEVAKFGTVSEEVHATSIHLVNRSAFAGVSLQAHALLVNIKSQAPLESQRFFRSEKISANRFHQELKLHSLDEVDAELLGWLRQAYELSS